MMNNALVYLWFALLRRKAWLFVGSLRRPTTLIGFAAVLGVIGCLWWFRHHEIFGRLVQPRVLAGGGLLMLCASFFKGFLHRGLVFEPPDIEFVFASPCSQRQIILYRLLPNYLYAVAQGLVVALLFAPHLRHPLLMASGLALFQITCFHLATAAAVFAGTLDDLLHHRLRCMMLGAGCLLGALFLRAACDLRLLPAFVTGPLIQLLFYPAVALPDLAAAPTLHQWAFQLTAHTSLWSRQVWEPALCLGGCALGAGISLWGVLRLKAELFEASLATTTRRAERRRRQQRGSAAEVPTTRRPSAALPALPLWRGVGAIAWKNFLVARRSRRALLGALGVTALFAWLLTALIYSVYSTADPVSTPEATSGMPGFNLAIAAFIMLMAFLLQRLFPFDFRRDGCHLLAFRTLPVSPVALVLAQVTVPVALVLACQALSLLPLLILGHIAWPMLLLVALAYPAVALGLSAVWNVHYLTAAARSAGSQIRQPSAVGTLLVVALSFLVFLPAVCAASYLSTRTGLLLTADGALPENFGNWGRALQTHFPLAAGGGLATQYLVDFLLLLLLAKWFRRLETVGDP